MSIWRRVWEFVAGPSRVGHDELDAWDYDAPEADWPPLASVPDEPMWGETEDARVPSEHEEGELGHDEEVEIGEPVTDDDGTPVSVLGLFGGRVRQGPLHVRRVAKGQEQLLVLDEETGIFWPVTEEELAHPTTERLGE